MSGDGAAARPRPLQMRRYTPPIVTRRARSLALSFKYAALNRPMVKWSPPSPIHPWSTDRPVGRQKKAASPAGRKTAATSRLLMCLPLAGSNWWEGDGRGERSAVLWLGCFPRKTPPRAGGFIRSRGDYPSRWLRELAKYSGRSVGISWQPTPPDSFVLRPDEYALSVEIGSGAAQMAAIVAPPPPPTLDVFRFLQNRPPKLHHAGCGRWSSVRAVTLMVGRCRSQPVDRPR
uniref:Uncharacterized protein n=1 Tax=Plectus sambesii TaxID=2011161 RepID=A0A914WS10_9BILA